MKLYTCRGCRRRLVSTVDARVSRCPECGGRLAQVWMPDVPRADPGSYPTADDTYASMDDFVRADPSRLISREVDFGVLWRERTAADQSYRAAWIEDTGELYVVQAGPASAGGGHVEVLGVTDRDGVETALRGWQDHCRAEGSMSWIRRRARRIGRGAAMAPRSSRSSRRSRPAPLARAR